MNDVWNTFPAQMGDHLAFISYNDSYKTVAPTDSRLFSLKIRLKIKNPTTGGMPTDEEFFALSTIDKTLEALLEEKGAVYVGPITVDGHRYFHYYVDFAEEVASETTAIVSKQTLYELQYAYEEDSEKKAYWQELYPTDDDWQMIRDMKVLEALRKEGDLDTLSREVLHWAYFTELNDASTFTKWIETEGYRVISVKNTEDGAQMQVHFSHHGTMMLQDITHHTIMLNRKAKNLNGDYDGWETSVEKEKI